jgi:hypothetical protein
MDGSFGGDLQSPAELMAREQIHSSERRIACPEKRKWIVTCLCRMSNDLEGQIATRVPPHRIVPFFHSNLQL